MRKKYSRRHFIRDVSVGSIALSPAISSLGAYMQAGAKDKLGIALVGLGNYSTNQLAPALLQTKSCYLAGIVTGTPSKESTWAEKYNIPAKNIYNYENFDTIANNPDIDIVYVVLPVSMHKEYTIRAARAGKHVICEKPMAIDVQECQEMIAACKRAKRMLSIGYRLHFEPHHQEMMRLGKQKIYGKLKSIEAVNGFVHGNNPDAWRLKKTLAGGGSLMDMGIYAIQASRYTSGEEPVYVMAREEKKKPELFKEVDETMIFSLEFPSGLVSECKSSYNLGESYMRVSAEKGVFELLHPTFYYGGIKGKTPDGDMPFPQVNHQALQMDDFAQCVLQNKPTRVPGELGLKDMKVIEAIYRSVASGKREKV